MSRFFKPLSIACLAAFVAIFSACSNKYAALPKTALLKTCDYPVAGILLGDVKQGDINIPNLLSEQSVEDGVVEALLASGCFVLDSDVADVAQYRLDIVYGSDTAGVRRGWFLSRETSDSFVFEIELAFSREDDFRVFSGNAMMENTNSQVLFIFGGNSHIERPQANTIVQNAINAAVNEASANIANHILGGE